MSTRLLIGLMPHEASLLCIHSGDGAILMFLHTLAQKREQRSASFISTEIKSFTSSPFPLTSTTGGINGFLNVAAASRAIPRML
jgi:hypothetical protein